MATNLTPLPLLFFLFFLFSLSFSNHSSAASTPTTTTKAALRLPLIHRDSPLSPFYNPNARHFDRCDLAIRRDIARRKHIRSVLQPHSLNPNSFQGPVTVPEGIYFLKLQIGTPPFQFFANVDTGSDLLWTQCLPCTNCYKQKDPIYNPALSSTQATVDCKSPQCLATQEQQCGSTNECLYYSHYEDGLYTSGVLLKESFTFESLDEGPPNVTLRDIAFGCGHSNSGHHLPSESGVVGFSRGQLSLVNQFGSGASSKFSYCLVPHTDNTVGSQLIIGDGAIIGVSAPLILLNSSENPFYYLNITGISVGNESLVLQPGIFYPRPDNTGGFMIDSGTTLTWLTPAAYDLLLNSMEEQITLPEINDPLKFYELCYTANYQQVLDFPVITFHFAEGLDVPLYPQYTFEFRDNNTVCLGVSKTQTEDEPCVLGCWFQQNLNIGYDLPNGRISLEPTDCATFETGV